MVVGELEVAGACVVTGAVGCGVVGALVVAVGRSVGQVDGLRVASMGKAVGSRVGSAVVGRRVGRSEGFSVVTGAAVPGEAVVL